MAGRVGIKINGADHDGQLRFVGFVHLQKKCGAFLYNNKDQIYITSQNLFGLANYY